MLRPFKGRTRGNASPFRPLLNGGYPPTAEWEFRGSRAEALEPQSQEHFLLNLGFKRAARAPPLMRDPGPSSPSPRHREGRAAHRRGGERTHRELDLMKSFLVHQAVPRAGLTVEVWSTQRWHWRKGSKSVRPRVVVDSSVYSPTRSREFGGSVEQPHHFVWCHSITS